MTKELLIATHNKAKLDYFNKLFRDFDLKLFSLADYQINETVDENGCDETENALIKARHYAKLSGLPSFSDDAGMYIPALDDMPGVQVRRWGGKFSDDVDDKTWLDFFMSQIKKLGHSDRFGYFKISRAIAVPGGKEYIMKWHREFKVLDEPNWSVYKQGWPMSAVTIDVALGKSFMELSEEEKILYEGKNILEFKKIFKEIYK